MPVYQNSSVDSDKLVLGNYKIETASSSNATYVNLGAGLVNNFAHLLEKYETQAGNAPDPIEGIARETVTVDAELIEYDGSVLSAIQCGAITESHTTSLSTINAGGNQALTSRAFRITNTRTISGTTVETILTVYKATLENGISFTPKSDNDTDPIQVMPIKIIGKLDTGLSAGSQLYQLTRTIV
jgi:hypothetical protein